MTVEHQALAQLSAFGKIRSYADFVHAGPSSRAFTRFNDWLTHSVEWAHARGGAAFLEAFQAGSARAFVYRIDQANLPAAFIVGAICPSADRAGRLFPLSIGASPILREDFLSEPQLLPFACEGIWQVTSSLIAEQLSDPSVDLPARLATLSAQDDLNFEEARSAYAQWRAAMPLEELWTLISGTSALESLRMSLRLVAAAIEPLRKMEAPETPLSLRFPLGAAGGLSVCFWLDVVRRLIGWRSTVPSFFWSHEGSSGQLTVCLGAPAASTIAELWHPTDRDEVCDLGVELSSQAASALPTLPPNVEQAITNPTSVAALLGSLDS